MNTKKSSRTIAPSQVIRLASLAEPMPSDLDLMLRDLGAGDTRFRGTTFGRGERDLQTFLRECRDGEDEKKIPADFVPQSIFWVVDARTKAIGMVRVRHRLNKRLLQYGGHIGYYIRPSERRKGYGRKALELSLDELRKMGVRRALLTVRPDNTASIRVVLANGGAQAGQGRDALSGEIVNRYWISLIRKRSWRYSGRQGRGESSERKIHPVRAGFQ